MVRKATGYVTFDGKFFDTQDQARIYETEHRLYQAFLEINGFPDDSPIFQQRYNALKAFISDYHELLTEYIDVRQPLWQASDENPSSDEVRGQSTSDNSSDDSPLRSEPDTEMANSSTPEAATPSRRKRSK